MPRVPKLRGSDMNSTDDFLSGADLIDRMHEVALTGVSLEKMQMRFKSANPHMIQYWMRSNEYIRNSK
jgi:hypothetical protein